MLTPVLAHTDVLVTQPIRDSYRDLPLGTAELAALLPDGARTIIYPVLRYDGLFPYQAIIRDPADPPATRPWCPITTCGSSPPPPAA
ncbi:WcbI family polysaccharide biosynthesis putative acetyltransferase [Corynebacterium suedekumii]|nr:WcbI family polysaccharide biosynthesis putative acetyltransferase [Corynebacterium suedekumii]